MAARFLVKSPHCLIFCLTILLISLSCVIHPSEAEAKKAIILDGGSGAPIEAGSSDRPMVRGTLNPTQVQALLQNGSRYGFSVATAGDVDGDGYSDILVGAPDFDSIGTNDGRAYLLRGGPGGTAVVSWITGGGQSGARYGTSVAPAGDVNGDGYADILVGAPNYSVTTNSQQGRAYLYLGGPSGPSTTPAWTFTGTTSFDFLGTSVSGAGDVNGDGLADVLVGAPGVDSTTQDFGKALLFLGENTPQGLGTQPVWAMAGAVFKANFGRVVSSAGDVNGDGFADVLVGMLQTTSPQSSRVGGFQVYLGSAAGLSLTAQLTVAGAATGDSLAFSLANAGDVDGDGYADVIIGMPNDNTGATASGAARIYRGSSSGLLNTPTTLLPAGAQAQQKFGWSVATAGDWNADGYADVIVGAPFRDVDSVDCGQVALYLGNSTGVQSSPIRLINGTRARQQAGFCVGTGADLGNTGFSAPIFGSPFDAGSGQAGLLGIIQPAAYDSLVSTPEVRVALDQGPGDIGAPAGDINGDGYSDFVYGNPNFGAAHRGLVVVRYGGPKPLGGMDATLIHGFDSNASFGYSAAYAGDVNGDGYSDIVVGAPNFTNGPDSLVGKIYVFLGHAAGLDTVPAWNYASTFPKSRLGFSVATAGDVNGDGFSDLIAGAPFATDTLLERGRLYVFHGHAGGLSGSPDWTIEGRSASGWLGYSVHTAGDVNADGFSDIVAGAPGDSSISGFAHGIAEVWDGSPGGVVSDSGYYIFTNTLGARVGWSVSGGGDVDGNGFSDMIYGVPGSANGAVLAAGACSIVRHGWLVGVSNPVIGVSRIRGTQTNENLGTSVSMIGDVNGDGYSDIVIGSPGFRGSLGERGKVVLALGADSTHFPSTPTLKVLSLVDSDPSHRLGSFVAGLGDVDGDGFGDLLAGGLADTVLGIGQIQLFHGNHSKGLGRAAIQRSDPDTGVVDLGLRSRSGTSFALTLSTRSAAGRERVGPGLEYSAHLAPAFTAQSASALDTGAPVAGTGSARTRLVTVSGLVANQEIVWRMRSVSPNPFFPHGPWATQPLNGLRETDLKTLKPVVGVGPGRSDARMMLALAGPNPSRGSVRLQFRLGAPARVQLAVYDVSGRRVARLVDGAQTSGTHLVSWDGRDSNGRSAAAGIYFARLESGEKTLVERMVRLR